MLIFLVGYMYSGKSTVGRKLAKAFGYNFVDTDDLFEGKYHISIPSFFEKYGETLFRSLEQEVLFSTKSLQHTVVSTGGGTPCSVESMEYIKQTGISVFLQSDIDTIMSRLKSSQKERPVLNTIAQENLQEFIAAQLQERTLFYQQANIIHSAKNVDVKELKELIERWNTLPLQ